MLYIVSTPIGHLKDITLRAIETLQKVDLIAAEDTRHTRILCKAYEIETPLTSFFEHNEDRKTQEIIDSLAAGKDVALVSDAGTPGVSDPGFRLIRRCADEGIEMTVVPGACAAVAGLTLSGFPSDRFSFLGFVSVKSGQRKKRFEELKGASGSFIFYESPHRLVKSLTDLQEVYPDARVAVVREISKKFEEVVRGNPKDVLDEISSRTKIGEVVLVISKP